MRRIVFTAAVLSSTAFLPMACNVEQPDLPKEEVEKDDAAIYGGTLDTTNSAVMFLYNEQQGTACTGTMIAKNGSTGYILTAGHCSGMDFAFQADDVNDCPNGAGCEGVYQVNQDTAHPNWNGNAGDGYDFRILRVSGATNAPVIPAAQNPDGLSDGAAVEVSGYGITEFNNNNSERRHVTENVVDLYSNPPLIEADQTDGTGSCSGDSGGPVIFNGHVVGVTSFGDQNCTQYGFYGRVQNVYSSWIAGVIGGVVMPTCDDCFSTVQQPQGACAAAVDACVNNQDCLDINDCFGNCSTDACYQDCINAHPTGWNLYSAFIDCACNACAVECEQECGGSSTTTSTTGSGPGPAAATAQQSSSAAAGMGGFGEGGSTGEGAADSTGSGTKRKNKDSDDDEDDETQTIDSCACSTPGSSASGGMSGILGLAGLGALAGAFVRRRRRP